MPASLQYVELENFKSYRGLHKIGPFAGFTGILGTNGAGKSSLLEAINFVLGMEISELGGNSAKSLIYRQNSPNALRSAFVTLTFELEDGTEKKFGKRIEMHRIKFIIDGIDVEENTYIQELKNVGLFANMMYFRKFLSIVEKFKNDNNKGLTKLLDKLSGSRALKADHESLKAEVQQVNKEYQDIMDKLKIDKAQIAELKREQGGKDSLDRWEVERAKRETEINMFPLYQNKVCLKKKVVELQKISTELKKILKCVQKKDQEWDNMNKNAEEIEKIIAGIEKKIETAEGDVRKCSMLYRTIKEETAELKKTVASATKYLNHAKKGCENYKKNVDELKKELEEAEENERTFGDIFSGNGTYTAIHADQMEEYNTLKAQVDDLCKTFYKEQESIEAEYKSCQCEHDNIKRKKEEIKLKIDNKRYSIVNMENHQETVKMHMKMSSDDLNAKRKKYQDLRHKIEFAESQKSELEKNLADILEQMKECQFVIDNGKQYEKMQKVTGIMKKIPGVYDRLTNICRPVHQRYDVAVTKMLKKYMNAFVVDNKTTAEECLKILREERLSVETFIPLKDIHPKQLAERLRNIRNPANVKLLFDVIKLDDVSIKNAVLLALGNVAVCETVEDARIVAFELDGGHRYNAVALDGTLFRSNGAISWNSEDAQRSASQWGMSRYNKLNKMKNEIRNQLNELGKVLNKKNKVNEFQEEEERTVMEETRSKQNVKAYETMIQNNKKELDYLENSLSDITEKLKEAEENVKKCHIKRKEKLTQIYQVQDEVFSEFCKQIGVQNARQLEGLSREYAKWSKRKSDVSCGVHQLKVRLQHEEERGIEATVEEKKRELSKAQKDFQNSEKRETKAQNEFKQKKAVLQELKNELKVHASSLLSVKEDMQMKKCEINKNLDTTRSLREEEAVLQRDGEIIKKKNYIILKACQSKGVKIPLQDGILDDYRDAFFPDDSPDGSEESDFSEHYKRASSIKIDFSRLRGDLKFDDDDKVKQVEQNLQAEYNSFLRDKPMVQSTNRYNARRLETLQEGLKEINEALDEKKIRMMEISYAEEAMKEKRDRIFKSALNVITKNVERLYKSMQSSDIAMASLTTESGTDESYERGLAFYCVVPGKKVVPFKVLSGGEKSMATLALLLAMNSYNSPHFFVLDEIDVALDKNNLKLVSEFLRKEADNNQLLIISHRHGLLAKSDLLLGIGNPKRGHSGSQAFSLDLRDY